MSRIAQAFIASVVLALVFITLGASGVSPWWLVWLSLTPLVLTVSWAVIVAAGRTR